MLTAADVAEHARALPIQLPEGAWGADEPHPLLAAGEVRYVGQPVAAVLAESRALAEDAAELVEVDYEPLDAVVDPYASTQELLRWERAGGDVEGAFAAADAVVSGHYAMPRLVAAPMETRGAIAFDDRDEGLLTVWCSAQDTHRQLRNLAHVLERPPESIRVVVPDVGGAFGSKGVLAAETGVVAVAALMQGRPVKWAEDRLENFMASHQGRGMHADVELALTREGRMLAIRARIVADLGGYLMPTTAMPPHTAAMLMCGVYRLAAADIAVTGRRTNKVPTGPYRGAGRPEAAYFVERIVDDAARELGIDPVELRRRNLVGSSRTRRRSAGPTTRATTSAASTGRSSSCAPERVGGRRAHRRHRRRHVRRALRRPVRERATIERAADGTVTIRSSASPHGQGHATTFAQIAAERLGIDLSAVTMEFGDSALVPAGDRHVREPLGGDGAARRSCRAIEDLEARGTAATGARASSPTLVFASGAYAAVVEIERATGALRVLRHRRGRRRRHDRQPAARRGAGDRRHRPGPRRVPARGGALRRGGPVHERVVPRLRPADRGRDAAGRDRLRRVAVAAEPARREGHRRGRRDRHAGRGGQRARRGARGRTVDPPFTAEKLWRALQAPAPAGRCRASTPSRPRGRRVSAR